MSEETDRMPTERGVWPVRAASNEKPCESCGGPILNGALTVCAHGQWIHLLCADATAALRAAGEGGSDG